MCKETAMQAMRSIFDILENKSTNNNLNYTIKTQDVENSISKSRPSISDSDSNKYKVWQSQYASY